MAFFAASLVMTPGRVIDALQNLPEGETPAAMNMLLPALTVDGATLTLTDATCATAADGPITKKAAPVTNKARTTPGRFRTREVYFASSPRRDRSRKAIT